MIQSHADAIRPVHRNICAGQRGLDRSVSRVSPVHGCISCDLGCQNLAASHGSYTVFAAGATSGIGSLSAKGLKKTISAGILPTRYQLPATLSLTGSYLSSNGGPSYLKEHRGSFVFDRVNSSTPMDFATTISGLQRQLVAQGYVQQ
jgi:hypothetical protein